MNRREALLAILLAPVGATAASVQEMKVQNGGTVHVLAPGVRLIMELVDKEAKESGVFELVVKYKGETQTFSAKEIWEALS